jgi:dihydrofolate synthase/folylpolyglutamate synthase
VRIHCLMEKNRPSYKKALQYLYGLQKYGIKFGLSKTSNLLKALGNPHRGRKYIHIAGSNGKGSVGAMLESILMRSGLRVGFYSSPHLVRFTERFRINGQEISSREAAELTGKLRAIIDPRHPPTFFEVTTAMALEYFARKETDVSIMEVGMGGRLDATNVIRPLVSVITNISLEHQFFLGSRLGEIAGEKGGIIKRGVDVVTAVTQPPVICVLEAICARKKASLLRLGRDFSYRSTGSGLNYYGLNRTLKGVRFNLAGSFQGRNATLALAAIEILEKKGFKISTDDILEGMKNTQWPGRMHVISREPLIVLDGAHNPGAIGELVKAVKKAFSYNHLILVLGVMADKDITKIINKIAPIADYVVCTAPDYYRSADPEDLMAIVSRQGRQGEVVPRISKAIDMAREMARPGDMILITGSLFTVGEALSCLDPVKYRPDVVTQ